MLLKLYLFGSPRIVQGDEIIPLRRRKGLALLAYLAVNQRPQSRETLLGLLWPEFSTDKARNNLRRELSLLKKKFSEPILLTDTAQVWLDPAAQIWVDVLAFQATAVPTITSAEQAEQMATAVALYSDDFLAGFSLSNCLAFEEWQHWQTMQLRQTLSSTLAALVNWHETQATYEPAIQYAQHWLTLDTLHEPVHRHLMKLYTLAGQQASSLRQYEECIRILDEELGIPPEEETTKLFEAIRTRKLTLPTKTDTKNDQLTTSHQSSVSKTQQPANKLPIPPTPFIGRTQEVAAIVDRLRKPACRLLSLIGPGGIGKTRLSLAVAEQLATSNEFASTGQIFADGVFFVPLQPVIIANNIPSAIAEAVHFRFHGQESAWQQLRNYLQQQQMLLVLDNFEHLLDGSHFVADILTNCQEIKLLVTSREALNLREEWFHPIAGMRYTVAADVPESGQANDTELADAAQLFAHHAARAQTDFDLANNKADVMKICQIVEGVPLAIELAAAWLRALNVPDIVAELEYGLDILTGYERDWPERHRSMHFVLEQSWQMLSQAEQQPLSKFSVFRGGFTRKAAQQITEASYPTLVMLVNKSWLQLKGERYQIHELVRQFLSQKLKAYHLAEQSAQKQHSDYYLDYLAQRTALLNGPEQQQALLALESELDNIRAAWAVGVEQMNLDSLVQSIASFHEMHTIVGRYEEASRSLQQAIATLDGIHKRPNTSLSAKVLAMLLIRQADIYIHLGQNEEAANYLHKAHVLPMTSEDKAWSYKLLSDVANAHGDRAAAEEYLQVGLAMSREVDNKAALVNCLNLLSVLATSFGEFESGQRLALECLDTARTLGRPDYIALALGVLAWATNCLGDYEASEAYWYESLIISQSIDNKRGVARALNFLGWETWSQAGDRLIASRSYHEEAITLLHKLGNRSHLVMALADFGLVTNELGDFETTVQRCSEGMAMAEEAGMPTYVAYNQTSLGVAQAHLGLVEQGVDQVRQAIKVHFETEQTPQCLLSLYYLMHLLVHYPDQGSRLNLREKQILGIVDFVAQHPFNYRPIRDRAHFLQESLSESSLPNTPSLDAELTLESVVASVLNNPRF